MKIIIDTELCQGHGICVIYAPAVFDIDPDTGLAIAPDEHPDESRRAQVMDAVRACPVRAITVIDE